MFESATQQKNIAFKNYVTSIVKDVDKTIYVDLHGTGRRALAYFEKEFNQVPYCYLLSIGCSNADCLPEISQKYSKKDKFFNLVSLSRGCSIELINSDLIGTLVDYSSSGPIRSNIEYDEKYLIPYHNCIKYMLAYTKPFTSESEASLNEIQSLINSIYEYIKTNELVVSKYIELVSRHEDPKTHERSMNNFTFDKILSNSSVYGVIWNAKLINDNTPVVIKIVALTGPKKKSIYPQLSPELFKDRKMMTEEAFLYEANHLFNLSELKLAPLVRGFWTYDNQYGFIVMDKMDSSLKQILVERELTDYESYIIESFISKMHDKGVIHGDLKPSNIGVTLNDETIVDCKVFDTQKVKQIKDTNTRKFMELVDSDWNMYRRHYEQNRNS
jgi:tRNA A-37 threonylcarbamoyl transferase component Bud32